MKKAVLAFLVPLLAGPGALPSAGASGPSWKFAVISDIHLGAQADPARGAGIFLKKVVARLIAERPDFVVIDGDFTRGTPDDKVPLEEVRAWWLNIQSALKPLRDAGIPVVPVPGNHDQYTAAHRKAYAEAWKYFETALSSFSLQGSPPLYYSFDHKAAHFVPLAVIDQSIGPEEEAWLRKDLKQAESAGLRFVFGHVPMDSALLGRPRADFRKKMSAILSAGRVAAYVSGHEHLNWDHVRKSDGWPVRQIIVGTAMDRPYNYPISRALYAAHCRPCDGECLVPYAEKHVSTDPVSRLQRIRQTFYIFEVDPALKDGYSATPYTLDGAGRLAPFYTAGSGPFAPCPAVKK
ncbi:MAG: metallophosphoesterase [Elusimicrobiales bacterium]|nr:metallophosphoesterase [Elusimicrobiales bacterium]